MKILIIGAGGHAKVAFDVIRSSSEYTVVGFIDDDPKKKEQEFCGLPILGSVSDLVNEPKNYADEIFIAIGDNKIRERIFIELKDQYKIINAIHSSAIISETVSMGRGILIVAGVIINYDSQIGDGVIVNTGATIDHDNTIGDFVHIAPGVNLAGTVKIGKYSMVGIGSAIIENITIGENTTIGGGSVVIDDIPDNCIAFGNPAKVKKTKK